MTTKGKLIRYKIEKACSLHTACSIFHNAYCSTSQSYEEIDQIKNVADMKDISGQIRVMTILDTFKFIPP